ncbi:MAG: HD domain-containing protein [Clostridia bacterium]|nr:HD domain-containing protein [Clostridia bacterium]
MAKLMLNDVLERYNEEICIFLFLKKVVKDVKDGRTNLTVYLTDASGELVGKIWNDFYKPDFERLEEKIVKVKGYIELYRGIPQIKVIDMRIAKQNEYDTDDFSPSVDNVDELMQTIFSYINIVKKPHIKMLLRRFFDNDKFLKAFKRCQGGTTIHHALRGGLALHTATVLIDAVSFIQIYEDAGNRIHEGFDRDMVIAGAILHDIGKVKEYKSFPINKRTIEGLMQGHLSLGYAMVYAAIRDMEREEIQFPKEDENKLLHIILTHHGELDDVIKPTSTGNILKPSCVEAVIISRTDEKDSRVNAFETAINEDNGDGDLTRFNYFMKTYIYKR